MSFVHQPKKLSVKLFPIFHEILIKVSKSKIKNQTTTLYRLLFENKLKTCSKAVPQVILQKRFLKVCNKFTRTTLSQSNFNNFAMRLRSSKHILECVKIKLHL